jgi:lipoyl(octanoyl) transferase
VRAPSTDLPAPVVRRLGRAEYLATWRAMQAFTEARTGATSDEFWLVEHPPVYTMGLKGRGRRYEPIHGIPVVQTDRGGDLTFHGPGQLVLYPLLDLRRLHLGPRDLVRRIEQSILELLRGYGIAGARRDGAPGVYVAGRKIASLGLRIRANACYHGLALNVNLDTTPFTWIDPCGYRGLEVVRLADLGVADDVESVGTVLLDRLLRELEYTAAHEPATGRHSQP